MSIQVVLDHNDLFGIGVNFIDQAANGVSVVDRRSSLSGEDAGSGVRSRTAAKERAYSERFVICDFRESRAGRQADLFTGTVGRKERDVCSIPTWVCSGDVWPQFRHLHRVTSQHRFFCRSTTAERSHLALEIVLVGWLGVLGVLDGNFQALGWLANPCWLLGMIGLLKRDDRLAVRGGCAAVLIAPLSLLLKKMTINEAGHTADVVRLGPGFYIWIAALGVQLIAAMILYALSRSAEHEEKNASLPIHHDPASA